MTIRSLPLFALLVAGLLVGCSSSDTTGPGNTNGGGGGGGGGGTPPPNTVVISGSAYSPDTLTVTVGTTVTFQNNDAITHTATGDNAEFDSGDLGHGGTATHTFNAAGTIAYHCNFHSFMHGVIKVQ